MCKLFFKLIAVSLRSQMQYPASFLMLLVSHFLGTLVDILGIWVLFDRFNIIQGWSLFEVGIIYGIIHMGFALAETFARGFDEFWKMIKYGDFDRVLLRPISPLMQLAASDVQIMRIGRFMQGLIVCVWSARELSIPLLSHDVLIILSCILGTACLFYGLFVIQAAISFWTVETLELMNITTFGGLQMGQYPLSIYNTTLRSLLTFVLPIACVVYYPIATILKHEALSPWIALTPMCGVIFLIAACRFWYFGVRYYRTTGS